jgi:diguanylate cyclase (GGDEF)-like protein/PAS domain S-box-containing protein
MKSGQGSRLRFFDNALLSNNGIARRIILALILFSSAITAVITAVELYLDYRADIRGIDERIESIRKVFLSTLTESVWVAESSHIQTQLDGLLNVGDIEFIGVVSDGETRWSAGARKSVRQIERILPLVRMHRGQDISIGELHVVGSVDNVLARLWSKLVVILVSNGIKTLLVSTFMLLAFQAIVGQHLERIAGYLRRSGRNLSEADDLRLNRRASGHWRPDALDHVTAAINSRRAELRHSESALLDANQQLAAIIQSSPLGIFTRDVDNIVKTWNPAAERIFGWPAAEVIGKPLPVPKEKVAEAAELTRRVLGGETIVQVELQRQRRDGSRIEISLTGAPLRNQAGQLYGYVTIVSDITERKAAELEIEYLAYHDTLTGLPNRLLAQDRFEQAIAYADRTNSRVALLFLDLDNFKTINDSLGHAVGDALLKETAVRLDECVRDTDTISRQGGDEFLIVLSSLPDADATAPVLGKVMERLQDRFYTEGHELSTSVSIGIALYPDDGGDFDSLLKKADMAMYRAKESGRNAYRFFDEQMNVEAVEHLSLRNGLRRAVERGEFVLHYQPQIDLASGAVIGAEALIRWNSPEFGLLLPARFIPLAEESGLIVPIGDWVMREACRQAMSWKKAGVPELIIAVNLSAVQFKRGDVERTVIDALKESGFEPALLDLEITESILIQNVESVLATVKRLQLLGVKLSIDDFGTGYSSLSYLKRFAVDKLKIDQSFIRDLASDPDDAAIVRAIIQMARSLNLKTVAEGVEDLKTLDSLRVFQCDEAQGYYFTHPMPAAEFASYLSGISRAPLRADPSGAH